MLSAKRHTLTLLHAADSPTHYHRHDGLNNPNDLDDLDDLDNDAIPLVPLTRVHSSATQQTPSAKQHTRRGRMYRYVSHRIDGAGNFRRRVLTSFRSDVTMTDPSFARDAADATANTKKKKRNGGDGGGGVCACSRCFSKKTTMMIAWNDSGITY